MHFKISAAAAVAILAYIPEASAHVRFLTAYGNWNSGYHIKPLGKEDWIVDGKDYGSHQHPGQWDVTVFSSPAVPASWESPFKKIPRQWMAQGCGSTIGQVFLYYQKTRPKEIQPPEYKNNADLGWKHANYHFLMAPIPAAALTQTKAEILKRANSNSMARATPGGWVEIVTWQVNDDGAGPYRCRIDETGTGENFGGWIKVLKQTPGEQSKYSVNYGSNKQHHLLRAQVPQHVKCSASYGNFKNVCILRCENFAVNGPFGGCIPFQVIYPEPKVDPPPKATPIPVYTNKPEPTPDYGDPGYDVGYNNYKEATNYRRKRDVYKKKAKRVVHAAEEA
ncbi:hypothetical protein TWF281_010829 [Arthrobotrys megalospora]